MTRDLFIPEPPHRPRAVASDPAPCGPGIGAEAERASEAPYRKDRRGRKPKLHPPGPRLQTPPNPKPDEPAGAIDPHAGRLSYCSGEFSFESNSGWGSNLDMLAIAHGPVGCGAFTQAARFVPPWRSQGVDGFTALHACTNLQEGDLDDGGDDRLARALDEARDLFPLAQGAVILDQDPIALLDSNAKGVAKLKARETDQLIVSGLPGQSLAQADGRRRQAGEPPVSGGAVQPPRPASFLSRRGRSRLDRQQAHARHGP